LTDKKSQDEKMEVDYDKELEEAIRLSLMDTGCHDFTQKADEQLDDDSDLLKAIELSLGGTQQNTKLSKAPPQPLLFIDSVNIPHDKRKSFLRARQEMELQLGVKLLPDHDQFRIISQSEIATAIAKSYLKERVVNFSILEDEILYLKSQHLSIFVDEAHLHYGCRLVASDLPSDQIPVGNNCSSTPRVRFSALHKLIQRGRNISENFLVKREEEDGNLKGNAAIRDGEVTSPIAPKRLRSKRTEALNYQVISSNNSNNSPYPPQAPPLHPGFSAKGAPAHPLITQLQKTITLTKNPFASSRILLLLAGCSSQNDRKINESIAESIHQAIFSGWKIELWTWKHASDPLLVEFQTLYDIDHFQLMYLDNYFDQIVVEYDNRRQCSPEKRPPQQQQQRQPQKSMKRTSYDRKDDSSNNNNNGKKGTGIMSWFRSSSSNNDNKKELSYSLEEEEDDDDYDDDYYDDYISDYEDLEGESRGKPLDKQKNTNNINKNQNLGEEEKFTCPITFDIFKDPVRTKYGHYYERTMIVDWIKKERTCPLTTQPLQLSDIREPEAAFLQLLKGYRKKNNLL
jgi:hypothetical protein